MRCRGPHALVILSLLAVACGGGTTEEIQGPTDMRCPITISVTEPIPAEGTVVHVPLRAARDCTWSVEVDGPGVRAEPGSGQGDATLTLTIGANPLGRVRALTLRINGQPFTIPQEPTPCRFTITPSDVDIPPEGGRVRVRLDTLEGCTWTAVSSEPWVQVTSARDGDGSAVVEIAVHSNAGERRSAEVRVGPVTVAVRQAPISESARGCPYSIGKGSANFPASGGNGVVGLHTRPSCAWGTAASEPWIVILSDPERVGTGDIRYRVEPNRSPARRAGSIFAGQARHVVRQAGSSP